MNEREADICGMKEMAIDAVILCCQQ